MIEKKPEEYGKLDRKEELEGGELEGGRRREKKRVHIGEKTINTFPSASVEKGEWKHIGVLYEQRKVLLKCL